jgi:hypothetical protein
MTFEYRSSQVYGWPFYMARRFLRTGAKYMQRTADAMSLREKYPSPFFIKPLLPDNVRLKNAHRGRRCFVIGNGPSLTTQNIDALAGEVTIVVNGFLNHPSIERFHPSYYCLADPCYFDGRASSEEFLDRLTQRVTGSHLLVPYSGASQILGERNVPAHRVSFIAFAGILASNGIRRLDFTRPIPGVTTCAELAMMLALYLGCSPIYLLGMDHDWLAHRGLYTHFYPQKTLENHPVAHGDMGKYPYGVMIEATLKVWRGYEAIHSYSQKAGQRIINCTEGGFLDVFERDSFQTVMSNTEAIARAA